MSRPGRYAPLVKKILPVLLSVPVSCLLGFPVQGTIGVVRESAPVFEISKQLESPADANLARQIEADLRLLSGIRSIEIDEYGTVRANIPELYQNGSVTYRTLLLALIADRKRVFQIEERTNSSKVNFAYTDAGTLNMENGRMYYRVYVDPADFESMKKNSRRDVASAFSIGIVLFHEISHKVSYDSANPIPSTGVRPDVGIPGTPGVIEMTNQVRTELGFPLRQPGKHQGTLYRGPAVRALRNTCTIEFIDSKGRRTPLRWKI